MEEKRLGQFLREIREEKKLSRKAVGDAIGVSGQVIADIEYGKAAVKAGRIMMFSDVYNLSEKDTYTLYILSAREYLGELPLSTEIMVERLTGYTKMNFNEYQEKAFETALYPKIGSNIYYPTMGLSGEAGEIANKVKKVMRDRGGRLTDAIREDLAQEIGDCLWYLSALSSELQLWMGDIATANIEKLTDRAERGTIQGSGDNR